MVISPVTGTFAHTSTNVWMLHLTGGERLGVTGSHPIYSKDQGGWVVASDLRVGEQVLTQSGQAILLAKEKIAGSHRVYNLEVKDYHNFLVGESGIVVHNTCKKAALVKNLNHPDFKKIVAQMPDGPIKDNLLKLKAWKDATPPNPKYQQFLDDFADNVPVEGVKAWEALKSTGLATDVNVWLPRVSSGWTKDSNL